jgi:hypothetical protein
MRNHLPDITLRELLQRADGLQVGCNACAEARGVRHWRKIRWRQLVTAFPAALDAPLAEIAPRLRCRDCDSADLEVHRDYDRAPMLELSPSEWNRYGPQKWREAINARISDHLAELSAPQRPG